MGSFAETHRRFVERCRAVLARHHTRQPNLRSSPMKLPRLLFFASALALSACNAAVDNQTNEQAQGTQAGIVAASMDTSVRPGDDFFRYANGRWVANTEIPADRSSIGGFFIADQQR